MRFIKKDVTNKKLGRAAAALVAAAVIMMTLFSMVFIIVEADHDCIGEHCRICLVLRAFEQSLGRFYFGLLSVSAVPVGFAFFLILALMFYAPVCLSPVKLKIRMNN